MFVGTLKTLKTLFILVLKIMMMKQDQNKKL